MRALIGPGRGEAGWFGAVRWLRALYAQAVVAGLVIAPAILVSSSLWALFGLTRGFVSIFGLLVLALAVASIALLVLAVGPTRRPTQARKRLAEQGLDLGI